MLEEKQVSQFLGGIDAFSEVSTETLDKLASAFHQRSCSPGEVVIRQGTRSTELCIVVEGELSVSVFVQENPDVSEAAPEIARLKSGDLFGEIGVISGMQASATVSAATEECQILALEERELHDQVLPNSPNLAAGLLRSMKRYL